LGAVFSDLAPVVNTTIIATIKLIIIDFTNRLSDDLIDLRASLSNRPVMAIRMEDKNA
jgi:hypothetical protein